MLLEGANEKTWRSVALLWCLLTICLYLPALEFGLFADDEIYLAFKNRAIRELPATELYRLLWMPANPWEFLPVRDFTYWLDLRLFGDDGVGLHATNLFLYAVSSLLTALFLREVLLANAERRLRSGVAAAAICGTALFMLHPAHVEAVVWIASRKDLLAGTLSLAALTILMRMQRCGGGVGSVAASGLFFLLACFSKGAAVAISVPATALVVRGLITASSGRTRLLMLVAFIVYASIAIAAILTHLHFGAVSAIRIENAPGLDAGLERASRILAHLLRMAVFPYDLGFLHQVYVIGSWHWLVSIVAGAGLVWSWLGTAFKRNVEIPLALLMLLAPTLPYLQFLPFSTWSMASERFLFLSVSGGSIFLAAVLVKRGLTSRALLVTSAVFALLAYGTWGRVMEWERPSILMQREYERAPTHYIPVLNYVSYVLIPDKEDQIDGVVQGIQDSSAREIAALFFKLRSMYMVARIEGDNVGLRNPPPTKEFCSELAQLYLLLERGRERLKTDPDVVFGNFLRSIDRQSYFLLADPRKRCEQSG